MPTTNPYSADLGSREPIAAMRETVDRIRSLVADWTPAQFERTYAPGKWTARQIMVHLAQSEMALGNRARMALATPDYRAQAFDQNQWIAFESPSNGASGSSGDSRMSGAEATAAVVAMNAMNRALFASLSAAARATPFSHPEYGDLTVNWIIEQMAGHLIHHLRHFEQIR